MPIYAYKCSACGFAKDTLQKMSDAPLTVCPACGESTFQKQVTAAGFQLKGSGWYVTDFREGGGKKAAESSEAKGDASPAAPAPADGAAGKSAEPATAPASSAPSAPATAPVPAPAPAPAASSKKTD